MNKVIKGSIWHRFWHGHLKEVELLYFDKYQFAHYSLECSACPNYCQRAEYGYSCKGTNCRHGA